MKVIYPDVLFLVNACADYLLLSLTTYLRGSRTGRLRLLSAACLGGVQALAVFFLPRGWPSLMASVSGCALMCYFAFGYGGRRRFLGDCAMLLTASFLFAGGTWALGGSVGGTSVYFEPSLKVLLAGTLLTYGLLTLIFRPGSFEKPVKPIDITCTLNATDLRFSAFTDTGNRLTEPMTGKGIIVVDVSLLQPVLSGEEGKLLAALDSLNVPDTFASLTALAQERYGLIPFTTAGGGGLMITVRPEALTVNGEATDRFVLGIGLTEVAPVCGCRALIGGIV